MTYDLRLMGLPAIIVLALFAGAAGTTATIESVRSSVQSGKVVKALRQIRELQRQRPDDPDLQFQIGELLQELAASRADALKKLAPESAQIHELMGKTFESHQKTVEAVAEYQLAVRANPALPGIHFLIGNLYWKRRDFAAAKPALESELKLNPDHALANLRMGEMFLVTDTDTPEKAIAHLKKAVTDPHCGLEAHRELGKALRLAHQYDEAYRELQLVEQQKPDDDQVHAQLAALYRDLGKTQEARRELELQREILQQKREATIKALESRGRNN